MRVDSICNSCNVFLCLKFPSLMFESKALRCNPNSVRPLHKLFKGFAVLSALESWKPIQLIPKFYSHCCFRWSYYYLRYVKNPTSIILSLLKKATACRKLTAEGSVQSLNFCKCVFGTTLDNLWWTNQYKNYIFIVTRRCRSDVSHWVSAIQLYWCDSGEWRYLL